MIKLAVLGTIGLDDIKTPYGYEKNILGGSATYASYAASFFCKTGVISIVGNDFPKCYEDMLKKRGIDLSGLKREGKTFRWQGLYENDMNEAKTLKTELNSLETYTPAVPDSYYDVEYLFLGNIDPEIQLKVLSFFKKPKLVAMDSMNLWINIKKDSLLSMIKKANLLIINDGEARMLFKTPNLVKAAKEALALGPSFVIIKKGEHGALLFSNNKKFAICGFPLENVVDPTGCGDCFGGSVCSYLARIGEISFENIKKAIIYGSIIASYNAQGFGLNRLTEITNKDIEERFNEFKEITNF